MLVSLTERKRDKIKCVCTEMMNNQICSIRRVAEIIGYLVAAHPGVWVAPVFYKRLEIAKNDALSKQCGNFDAEITITQCMREDLNWWVNNVDKYPTPVNRGKPDIVIKSDASKKGWGAVCRGVTTGGMWDSDEAAEHINCLELKAALFALKSLCRDVTDTHIQLQTDNSTTVACVNNLGSTKPACNDITRDIWLWCLAQRNFVTAIHIPGSTNVEADFESRVDRHEIEWRLDSDVFQSIIGMLGVCDIDLFASRVNAQLHKYVSWKPDPDAYAIDAFSLDWSMFRSFCFPPFSLIPRVLQKLELHQADIILVAPMWTTQAWFPKMIKLLVDFPVNLPPLPHLLMHPLTGLKHPLLPKLTLVACALSGKLWKTKAFLKRLQTLSCQPGEREQRSATTHTLKNGSNIVLNGVQIPFVPLRKH
jgi:hypothetical protein